MIAQINPLHRMAAGTVAEQGHVSPAARRMAQVVEILIPGTSQAGQAGLISRLDPDFTEVRPAQAATLRADKGEAVSGVLRSRRQNCAPPPRARRRALPANARPPLTRAIGHDQDRDDRGPSRLRIGGRLPHARFSQPRTARCARPRRAARAAYAISLADPAPAGRSPGNFASTRKDVKE